MLKALGNYKGDVKYGSKNKALEIKNNKYDSYLQKDGSLNSQGRRSLMLDNDLVADQYFTYNGKTYRGQGR